MKAERAIEVLEMLMEGIDPDTDEALPQAFLFEQADVILALCRAVQSLRREIAEQPLFDETKQKITKNGRLNAGRSWTKDDDQRLRELVKSQVPLERMCIVLNRRLRGVKNRLAILGISTESIMNDERPARVGAHWLPEEDEILQKMFENGRTMAEMGNVLQRSKRGVAYRLERLQLIDDAEDYLAEIWQEKKYDKDDLKDHFLMGETISDLAKRYHITEQAVRARLFYMGLIRDAPKLYRHDKEENP